MATSRGWVVAFGPDAFACFGYSGRGICPGTIFGTETAAALLDRRTDTLPVAPVASHHESQAALQEAWFEAGASLTHAVQRGPLL